MRRYLNVIKLLLTSEVRNRNALLFSLGLPVLILVLIGSSDKSQVRYVYPGVVAVAFGTMALIGMPVQLTNYRATGILRRVKLTEMGLMRFLSCVLIAQTLFLLSQFVLLTLIAKFIYQVKFAVSPHYWWSAAIALLLASGSLLALGLIVAACAKNARTASTIGNAVVVLMMFVGNTLFPANNWPHVVTAVVKYLPMNNLVANLRQTLMYNTQTSAHVSAQLINLGCMLVLALSLGGWWLKRTVTK